MQVRTGAGDDGSHRARQVAVAVIGWLLAALLLAVLSGHADEGARQVAKFLFAALALLAVMAIGAGVELFRPPLLRARGRPVPPPAGGESLDALGRPIELPAHPEQLTGEITVELVDGVRRYTPLLPGSPP